MGTCIICGTPTDGRVCESHQEDVAFEFRGNRPGQLVAGRYYRGEVDGFADFGVFVNIGDDVTGLLHRSEIDGRLESLDWDVGDEVYVQVLDVHDNGNIDLGWSIRQSPREFRGELVHDPTAGDDAEFTRSPSGEDDDADSEGPVGRRDPAAGGTRSREAPEPSTDEREPEPPAVVSVSALEEHLGERVRLEGEIAAVRQTGGPTIFEFRDETGTVDCAAFVEAGERAYPDIDTGAVVSIIGDVERHRGDLQVETQSIESLEADEREAVSGRLADALQERATAPGSDLLVDDDRLADRLDELTDLATALRRAILGGRSVVIRHAASVDGYVAGAAVERSLSELVEEVHEEANAAYRYVERRPLPDDVYDMSAATKDVTTMLDAEARHEDPHPLFVFAGVGETAESVEGFDLLGAYDVERIVIAAGTPDSAVSGAVEQTIGIPDRSAGTIAATVAVLARPDLEAALVHLPAISYWNEPPQPYVDLATSSGHALGQLRAVREALALQAYYQSWEDKRELVRDLFWAPEAQELATDLAEQFERRLTEELETADPHVDLVGTPAGTVRVLDVDAHTHRFDFPPTPVLLDELHRRGADDAVATVGIGSDDVRLRASSDLDLASVAEALADRLPEAGVRVRNGRRGRLEFLQGERDAVRDAVVDAIGEQITSHGPVDPEDSPPQDPDPSETPADIDTQLSED